MAKRKPRQPPRRSSKDPQLDEAVELALVRGVLNRVAPALADEFGVTERTVKRYATDIRKRWASEEAELRPAKRERFRGMLMEAWRIAIEREPRQMASVLALIAKFDGLDQPAKVEVSVGIDIRAMSPQARQAEISRLIAKRAASLDGRQAGALSLPEPDDTRH